MKRVVLTWNSAGKWTPPNVMESHADAARRWGAELVVRTDATTGTNAFTTKGRILYEAQGDQVVWLDGDAIVRFDCPNLFEIVPRDTFAGAPNFQGDTHARDPWLYHEGDWSRLVMEHARMDLAYNPATFINGGVIVFAPAHHRRIWEVEFPAQPGSEQALLNFRADMLGLKRMTLSPSFNRIGAEAWKPGPMRHFVHHLAQYRWTGGESPRRADRREYLTQINWRQAA